MKLKNNQPEASQALRLQVFLARGGVGSRRFAETLIAAGRVSVNGQAVSVLGTKVLPGDQVSLDGRHLKIERRRWYLAIHKPPEYLCSSADPQGRSLALDLLPPEITERLYSIGRLDYRSSGLIMFTNDGDFAAAVSHPSAGIEKEYILETSGLISDAMPDAFIQGIRIEGICYQAERIERLGKKILRIVLIEGKNREIRRVVSYFHLHPVKLCRIRIGPVLLGNLRAGEYRQLTKQERSDLGGRI